MRVPASTPRQSTGITPQASPMTVCHLSMGIWLASGVERRSLRFSRIAVADAAVVHGCRTTYLRKTASVSRARREFAPWRFPMMIFVGIGPGLLTAWTFGVRLAVSAETLLTAVTTYELAGR